MINYLICFLVSMIPIVELRGAIPIAYGMGLDGTWQTLLAAYGICVIGNMLPVPFIYFFARKILEWGDRRKESSSVIFRLFGRFCSWVLVKGHRAGEKLTKKGEGGYFIALMCFVGIPLPGTGAWTGTLAASILDKGFRKSCVAVMAGVLMAGMIMAVLSFFFKDLFITLFM